MSTIKEFVQQNRENLLRDLKRVVDINSIRGEAAENAPYGLGVRKAEDEFLAIAKELGFESTYDCEGRMGYAHIGPEDRFIGVIGHADVVPVGEGWFQDPFDMFEKDGYLVGRGTGDDKGPLLAGMYACKYLIENKIPLRYGIRVLIGCDEECGMSDLDYYLANYPEPIFAFTPDAGFPVGHGEKGIFSADLVSAELPDGIIENLHGGMASNVVPDVSTATLPGACFETLAKAAQNNDAVEVKEENGKVVVTAHGKAAHAGMPFDSINANGVVLQFLLDAGVLSGAEKEAVAFMAKAASSVDGTVYNIQGEDGLFAKNSIISGMIRKEGNCLVMNVNSRYNTSIPAEEIVARVEAAAKEAGFTLRNIENSGPFYMDPQHPAVQLMANIYNEVTGENEKPFVMSGGTYARKMNNAVSFGCEMPNEKCPDWVGGAHMTNEALSIDTLMKAFEIYIETLVRLQEVEL